MGVQPNDAPSRTRVSHCVKPHPDEGAGQWLDATIQKREGFCRLNQEVGYEKLPNEPELVKKHRRWVRSMPKSVPTAK